MVNQAKASCDETEVVMQFSRVALLMMFLTILVGCSDGNSSVGPPIEPGPVPDSGEVPQSTGDVTYD